MFVSFLLLCVIAGVSGETALFRVSRRVTTSVNNCSLVSFSASNTYRLSGIREPSCNISAQCSCFTGQCERTSCEIITLQAPNAGGVFVENLIGYYVLPDCINGAQPQEFYAFLPTCTVLSSSAIIAYCLSPPETGESNLMIDSYLGNCNGTLTSFQGPISNRCNCDGIRCTQSSCQSPPRTTTSGFTTAAPSGLHPGIIAAIVVGAVLLVVLLILICACGCKGGGGVNINFDCC